jgi:hypothetical protein
MPDEPELPRHPLAQFISAADQAIRADQALGNRPAPEIRLAAQRHLSSALEMAAAEAGRAVRQIKVGKYNSLAD